MTSVVGIDLAWGDRAASGVVVAGRDGTIRTSATVTTDADILALVPVDAVALAIDAPLVVPNETGARRCDRELSRCLRRFHAGAYPANRSIPWLREPRGGRLATATGASLDPDDLDAGRRVALEVYPHAASVVLFGLDRVLPYKPRRHRTRETRRAALDRLLDHLESLARDPDAPLDVTSSPRWSSIREAVAVAPTKAALDRVEDEVDAYLCAAVGLLAVVAPSRVARIGAPDEGLVVTPRDAALDGCLAVAP